MAAAATEAVAVVVADSAVVADVAAVVEAGVTTVSATSVRAMATLLPDASLVATIRSQTKLEAHRISITGSSSNVQNFHAVDGRFICG